MATTDTSKRFRVEARYRIVDLLFPEKEFDGFNHGEFDDLGAAADKLAELCDDFHTGQPIEEPLVPPEDVSDPGKLSRRAALAKIKQAEELLKEVREGFDAWRYVDAGDVFTTVERMRICMAVGSLETSLTAIQDSRIGFSMAIDYGQPVYCPHGEPPEECDACHVASDLAYDAARESK